MKIKSYKDLKVWQKAMDLSVTVYRFTSSFPQTEKFGLVSQMNRASVSVVSNIAEGSARESTKELLRFIDIALGSLAELESQIMLAERLQFGNAISAGTLLANCDEVGKMLRGLAKSLKDSSPSLENNKNEVVPFESLVTNH